MLVQKGSRKWCPVLARSEGFTLIEVLLVVIVIGIMAAVAFKSMDVALDNSRWDATTQEMEKLSSAIAGNPDLIANGIRSDFGYVGDVGSLPPNLDALVANPGGYATWRGPYIQTDFTQNPNDYKTDAWGNLYTYAGSVSITSSGSGGNNLTKKFANAAPDLTANTVQGVVTDAQGDTPGTASSNISIRITYPNGSGGTTTATTSPSSNGNYGFSNIIPQGLRTVTAINTIANDTLLRTAVVLPRTTTIVDIRFLGDLGGTLVYVSGSASTSGAGNDNLSFQVKNNGSSSLSITSLKATYATAAYYEEIKWAGTSVANSAAPRNASGQTVSFSPSQTINAGVTVTVELKKFRSCQSGACSNVDMRGTSFTVTFSDGSVITFSV